MHSFDDDKELDQLSKIAAEAIDAPGVANWEKMQLVLDKELPQQKKRRGGIIWWLLPSLLAIGLGIYLIPVTQKHPLQKESIQKANIQNSIVKQIMIEPTIIKSKKLNPIENTYSIVTQNQEKKDTISTASLNYQIQINNTISNSNITKEPNKEKEVTKVDLSKNNNFQTNDSNIITAITDKKIDSNKNTEPKIKFKNKSQDVSIKKGLFVGLIGGFDASTVKYNYISNAGYNFGGTIGYRFNNHWSVQTGAIYTQKNYKLKGEDFHAPKGSWISNYEIETVDGYCKMWDIPILATYHFNGNKEGNTFLSFGTSSYFMKNENYNYLYTYNNQYYTRTNNYKSSDQHLFALLHISGGIEKPIGKNIISIIEPYAKIPITGVGFGSIQLSSFGLNFSVQYKQPKK